MLDASAKQGTFKRIRLVIVDRQPIVLQGLKSVLGAQQDFDVVASANDGTSGLEAVRNLTPDVALIADTLPDLTTSEILVIAKAEKLSARLVFFTESDIDHDLAAAIAAGACSAISKYAAPATMLRSLRLMTKSGVSLDRSDLAPTGGEGEGDKIGKMLELLTQRERQIVRLVSEGMSNKEIARQLDVSQGTVKVHLYNIFQKLEITNRTVLATIALLQRTSGFSALALAFLAFAIADELKASEANHLSTDDNGTGHAGEHAVYEVWKKAILQRLIVSETGETPPFTERDFFARASQTANSAAAMEALRAAEQFMGSKPWKDGPVGSSTPDLPAPLLRRTNDTLTGGEATSEHYLPRLASNPMSSHEGYGTFAALAAALIYALSDSDVAAQPHHPGQALIDSVLASGESAIAKLAVISHVHADHAENSVQSFLSQDFHPPFGVATTGNGNIAQEGGTRGQLGSGAAGDNLPKSLGMLDSGHDAGIGGYGGDQLVGRNLDKVVGRSPIDFKAGSSDSAFEFESGPGGLNLAAFGALAWLHLTAATKCVPPHTLAWFYDPASNQTIVYVNPTDRVLDVGDRGLLEIHLQGIVAIAEAEVVAPSGAIVAVTLEQLEQALVSPTATDETVSRPDNIHASESSLGTAGVWSAWADDGLSFQFAQAGTGSGASEKLKTFTSDSEDAAEESSVSAHGSSIAPDHNAAAPAIENLTSKSAPVHADTDAVATKQNEIVQSSPAMVASLGPGNSDHVSEPGSAKPTAAEPAEAASRPDNGVGNDNGHHSKASDGSPEAATTADSGGVEHGKSGHSASAIGPDAAESTEPSVATADKDVHGNSHQAGDPGAAEVAAVGMPQAKSKTGNGVGNDNGHNSQIPDGSQATAKTAESGGGEHGNSEHSASAKGAEASESAATPANADHGNSQHAAGSGQAVATETIEAKFKPDSGVGNAGEHHSQAPESGDAPTAPKTAEPVVAEHGRSGHDLPSPPANAAHEFVQPSVAMGHEAGGGNAEQGAQSDAPASEAAQPAQAASGIGSAEQEATFRFDGEAAPSTFVSTVEPGIPHDPHGALSREEHLRTIIEMIPNAPDEHAVHDHNGQHHGIATAPHDWLI